MSTNTNSSLAEYLHRTVTADLGGRHVTGRVTDVDYGLASLRAPERVTLERENGTTIAVSPKDILE
ncbi:hypothetical protein [Halalkalicoccus jeotgali]|uniref:PRC-barrel domain-containing protein n=1 Tax=Halalkalicoccus jeotgali (strain DSM 18796 / CECT 7217 / JCM 14584 / KCTC 4019 / B3) TaxID=795797 RepID=D8J9X8_HALJB|nr:hypothetical protein [Halalkalicoccus jeotgali]ADJ14500.1 hypothetical protein HacjB3_05545 [Halalkalicoccus jeotgali B3]ELY40212.1 hypothetical protein C497_03910 [Halalkalicoccus jeotgali B3]